MRIRRQDTDLRFRRSRAVGNKVKKTGLSSDSEIQTTLLLHHGLLPPLFWTSLATITTAAQPHRKRNDIATISWETLCTVLFGWFYWSLSCGQWRGSYRPCGSSFRYVLCCWVDNPRVYSPVSYVAMLRFIEYLTVPSDLGYP